MPRVAARASACPAPGVDAGTRRYYEKHADAIARSIVSIASPLRQYFATAFAQCRRVLDVGVGPGRETAALLDAGYDAWGVEPIAALREFAVAQHPGLRGRLCAGALPDALPPVAELGGLFDGVLCNAVLQHVPRARVDDALRALGALLVERGRVLVSVPATRPGIDGERDAGGRLFTGITTAELASAFERTGFAVVDAWERNDALGRPGHSWSSLCAQRCAKRPEGAGPVTQTAP